MPERIPLFYTFGNHHHWVDMEWLWGYKVTPDSVRDLLRYCQETGAKGNVNFDGVGYEKMAAECPEALTELKDAIAKGNIEPVGCSYGQPYGLFHGGESNIRQRIYGVRAVMRLLGYRPRTFWEEEFDFFPQLPQILKSCGFEYASLYFQWTWHTPEVPKEDVPVVWWEAPDGSRLLTATRNRLNLHQWPEDFQILLDELAAESSQHATPNTQHPLPLILQWLELIPSPDWMCRSELMIPMLKKLLADRRFEVKMGTLGDYLKEAASQFAGCRPSNPQSEITNPQAPFPVRRYTMDQVWHGMSLGKNGDAAPRSSHYSEACLLATEVISSLLGLFGRPYPDWDVYPVWELEEAWRNLLAAQHHDNHECEGLCGHIADPMYSAVSQLTNEGERGMEHLARRVGLCEDQILVFNRFGWHRKVGCETTGGQTVLEMTPFSYQVLDKNKLAPRTSKWKRVGDTASFERGSLRIEVDLIRGRISRFTASPFEKEAPLELPLLKVEFMRDGELEVNGASPEMADVDDDQVFVSFGEEAYWLRVPEHLDALEVEVSFEPTLLYDKGMNAGPQVVFRPSFLVNESRADLPAGVDRIVPGGKRLRKYPSGDWMTSPQWFEEVRGGFTSQSFVDLIAEEGKGLLILHNGSQQWFARDGAYRNLVSMIDPWDEHNFSADARTIYLLLPHGPITDASRWKLGREMFGKWVGPQDFIEYRDLKAHRAPPTSDMPLSFQMIECVPANVLVTAFYREEEYYSGRDLKNYAGIGMGHPFVIRLVEFDGLESDVELTLPGPIAKAFKTNLMGEPEAELVATKAEPLDDRFEWQKLGFKMRPHEIATVYADLVPGRKQVRDLDAKREVWATVHRVEK